MISRVGDLAFSQRMTMNSTATQTRMREANEEIATGRRVDRFADLGADARFLVRSETALSKTEGFLNQNQRVLQRVQAIDKAMEQVVDLAGRARNLLTQRINGATGSELPLEQEMASITSEMTSILNRRFAGHYIFGGSRTDIPPVDSMSVPTTDIADDSFYQGDRLVFSSRIDIAMEVTLDVTAGDEGFRSILAGLGLAARGHETSNAGYTTDDLGNALELLSDGVRQISEQRGGLGIEMGVIESTMDSQEQSALYLKERISDLVDTDLAEAISRLSADRTSLEASYSALAQMSSLSLVKFL